MDELDQITALVRLEMEKNPPKRWGKWYLQLIFSEEKIVEIGIGENIDDGDWGPFQSQTKYFLCFYLTVTKPTLRYLKKSIYST